MYKKKCKKKRKNQRTELFVVVCLKGAQTFALENREVQLEMIKTR